MDGMWGNRETIAAMAKIKLYSQDNNLAPTNDNAYKLWLLDKLKAVHAEDYSEIEKILMGIWGSKFPGESKVDFQNKSMDEQAGSYRRLMQLIDDPVLYEGAVFGRNPKKVGYM